jgi:hypothetical protein
LKLQVKCKMCGEPVDINVLYAENIDNVLANISLVCKKCSGIEEDEKEKARNRNKKYKKKLDEESE